MIKKLLIFVITGICSLVHAQIVNIPDLNFKAALLSYSPAIDINNDKEIQISEAILVKSLYLTTKSISNLTGIEAFTSLTLLNCNFNLLTTIDLSSNIALESFYCTNNQLTSINVSKCSLLITFDCSTNKLLTLDLSLNAALVFFNCYTNPNLTLCITTNQLNTKTPIWSKDVSATYNTNCVITDLQESKISENTDKEIHKIFSLQGQEIKPEQAINGVFIYKYTDGSTSKIVKSN